jgi:chromosome segregation ATPase
MSGEQQISRRRFIQTAALTAVAATAAGTGAAMLAGKNSAPIVVDSGPVVLPDAAQVVLTGNEDLAELFAKLAAAQAENVRLKAELDAAQRNLSAWQDSGANASSQAQTLSAELENSLQEVSVLSGLVALYEQLDEVDVPALLEDGVTAVSQSFDELMSRVPTLTEGMEIGQMALTEFEEQLPLLENGRIWLERNNEKLQAYFDALESLLANAVDSVAPFLEMLTAWFQDIRKWLPFNIGQKAAEVMESATLLLSETPHTISGLRTNVAQPLDQWLAYEDDDIRVRRNLIKPMREKVLDKAKEVNDQVETVKQVYDSQLAAPWQTAVEQQQTLRQLIAEYRQEHQL